MTEIKIMTYNCRGLGTQEKRRDVVNFLKNLEFDIYLLQDTHLTERTAQFFDTIWRGKCYHSFGTHNSRGTSILFKPKVQHSIIYEERCRDGNFLILACHIFLNTYTIASIYGPNDDCPTFFDELYNNLEELTTNNIIVGGDFNFVTDRLRDSNYIRHNNPGARNAFSKIIEQYDLIDAWREMNPHEDEYTWTRQNPLKYGRLDRIYIQDHLMNNIISVKHHPGYRSDHNIVALGIREQSMKKGPGLWKFNASLLEDKLYNKLVEDITINVVKQYASPIYNDEYLYNTYINNGNDDISHS